MTIDRATFEYRWVEQNKLLTYYPNLTPRQILEVNKMKVLSCDCKDPSCDGWKIEMRIDNDNLNS